MDERSDPSVWHTTRRWAVASDRAMPGERRAEFGDWVARSTNGITGRANTASVVADPGLAAAEVRRRLATVSTWYEAQHRPAGVQRWRPGPPAAGTEDLDAGLAAAGFVEGPGAVVYACDAHRLLGLGGARPPEVGVALSRTASDELAAWLGEERLAEMATPLATRFAGANDEGGTLVGRALSIRDGDLVGIFAVETWPALRGRGVATALMGALVDEAMASDPAVTTAWLQVAPDNVVARRLYERLGFEPVAAYDYWWRR